MDGAVASSIRLKTTTTADAPSRGLLRQLRRTYEEPGPPEADAEEQTARSEITLVYCPMLELGGFEPLTS